MHLCVRRHGCRDQYGRGGISLSMSDRTSRGSLRSTSSTDGMMSAAKTLRCHQCKSPIVFLGIPDPCTKSTTSYQLSSELKLLALGHYIILLYLTPFLKKLFYQFLTICLINSFIYFVHMMTLLIAKNARPLPYATRCRIGGTIV